MTPEARYFLDKAHRLLGEPDAVLTIGLNNAAGRTAYLAGFHAAQAFIAERTGRGVKTHRGVHTTIYRLTRDEPRFDDALRGFLSKAYNLKGIADYEIGPDADGKSGTPAD